METNFAELHTKQSILYIQGYMSYGANIYRHYNLKTLKYNLLNGSLFN